MATILTRIVLRNDSTTNWATANTKLLKGEVGVEFTDTNEARIKIGDGERVWSELPYFGGEKSDAQVYQCDFDPSQDLNDTECIERYVDGKELFDGDFAIVKKLISEGYYSYTAYVYDNSAWVATDGNYDANNVILNSDITLAGDYTQVGNLTKTKTGTATFNTKGKSIAAALTEIFSKRLQPGTPTAPKASISLTGAGEKEVGEKFTPTYSASLTAGSYTYGPATGITATSYSVTDSNGNTSTLASGSFNQFTVGDETNYKVSVSISHGEGAVAKDNLGDPSNPEVKISAGSKTASSSAVTGYRKMFFGTMTTKPETMTSANIRALSGVSEKAVVCTDKEFSVPVGALRVVCAVPSEYEITVCRDKNGFDTDLISTGGMVGPVSVNVEGANSYEAQAYNVYYQDLANANDTANTYKVTVAVKA